MRKTSLDKVAPGHTAEITFRNGETLTGTVTKVNKTSILLDGERINCVRIDSVKVEGKPSEDDRGVRVDLDAVETAVSKLPGHGGNGKTSKKKVSKKKVAKKKVGRKKATPRPLTGDDEDDLPGVSVAGSRLDQLNTVLLQLGLVRDSISDLNLDRAIENAEVVVAELKAIAGNEDN